MKLNKYLKRLTDNLAGYEILFNYLDYSDIDNDHYLYPLIGDKKKCIFCLKEQPVATFNTRPHVIPEFLGNRHLLHHNECDECNALFGETIERELSEYVRPFRMLARIKSKKKKFVPYTSINQKSSFKFDKETKFFKIVTRDEVVEDDDNKEFTYNFEIPKHTPVNVYKGLMKIFYGLLPHEHRNNFELLRSWINNQDVNDILIKPLELIFTMLPYMNKKPLFISILYKKNKDLERMLNHSDSRDYFSYIAILSFGNACFEMPLLCDLDLVKMQQKFEMSLKRLPNPYGITKYKLIDLSGTERITHTIPLVFGYERKIPIKSLEGVALSELDTAISNLDINKIIHPPY